MSSFPRRDFLKAVGLVAVPAALSGAPSFVVPRIGAEGTAPTATISSSSSNPTAEIQAAIDSLPKGGGQILLESGTYDVGTFDLRAKDGISFAGENKESTTLRLRDGEDDDMFSSLTGNARRCHWRNLQLDGNKKNNRAGRAFNLLADRCVFENLYVHDFAEDGLRLFGTDTHLTNENVLLGVETKWNDGSGLLLEGKVQDTDAHALISVGNSAPKEGANVRISANLALSKSRPTNNKIIGGLVSGLRDGVPYSAYAVLLRGAADTRILGTLIELCQRNGILIESTKDFNTESNLIVANTIVNHSQEADGLFDAVFLAGTEKQSCFRNVIMGNRIRGKKHRFAVGLSRVNEYDNLALGNSLGGGFTIAPIGGNRGINALQNVGVERHVSPIAVGPSPFTYTSGNTPETVYVSGGVVSKISKDGITIFSASHATVQLMPGESITIHYSVPPLVAADSQ